MKGVRISEASERLLTDKGCLGTWASGYLVSRDERVGCPGRGKGKGKKGEE